MAGLILKIHNLSKHIGEEQILDSISLTLKKGEIYGLLGPNGAGKTSLMRSILSYTSYQGEIIKRKESRVVYVPEVLSFYDYLTGEQAVHLLTNIQGYEINKVLKEFEHNANVLKYYDKKKMIKEHSKGNLRKLMLLQAMSVECDLLLLDEPFSGLDPLTVERLISLLCTFARKSECAILINTHLLESAKKMCDELFFIENGKIIKQISKLDFANIDLDEIFG